MVVSSRPIMMTSQPVLLSPSAPSRKRSHVQVLLAAMSKGKRRCAVQRDVVPPPVPNRGIRHPVSAESKNSSNNSAGENVVPVVVLVDSKRASDQAGPEDRCVQNDQLPHGRVIIREYFQLAVQVETEEDQACKGGSGVPAGHTFQRVVDLIFIAGADLLGIVDACVSPSIVPSSLDASRIRSQRQIRLANGKEVRAKATNEPLDENLEHGGGD